LQPPYNITEDILKLVASISEKLGEINAVHLDKPTAQLRKKNRIKTIQSSLEIEGNSLSEEQITSLLENKQIVGPPKDILEVQNAIKVYELLREFNPNQVRDLLKAHEILMNGLIENPGKLRTKNVGIIKGSKLQHLAPSEKVVRYLLTDLFSYLKEGKDQVLVKSCVFHYEFQFIHPFMDGNGRMGRLWQTLILMQHYTVFEFLPTENLIKQNQEEYYNVLSQSDKLGHSTHFIEFMLKIIHKSLENLLKTQNRTLKVEDRVELFKDKIGKREFRRKDYLQNFKEISQATASRDLKWAVGQNILIKNGDKRKTKYKCLV